MSLLLLLLLLLIPNCFKIGYFKYAFLCKLRVLCLGFTHNALQEPLNTSLKNNGNERYCVEKSHLKNRVLCCWPHGSSWWCVANGTGWSCMVSRFILLGHATHILVWLTFTDSFLTWAVLRTFQFTCHAENSNLLCDSSTWWGLSQ